MAFSCTDAHKVTENLKSLLTVPMVLHLLCLQCVNPLPSKGDVRRMDDEVWALLSNFSNGRAASSPLSPSSTKYSSKSSFSSSSSLYPSSRTSSSSARWSLRNLSPPSPPSGISASVRPTRPQPYSPGHAPRLQVHPVKDCAVLRFHGRYSDSR